MKPLRDAGLTKAFVSLHAHDELLGRRTTSKVGDWERLECLYLLTVSDIRATNPKLWNGWKARLLSDLYQAARFQLRRGTDQPVNRLDRVRADPRFQDVEQRVGLRLWGLPQP